MASNPILDEIGEVLRQLPPRVSVQASPAAQKDRDRKLAEHAFQEEALSQAVQEVLGKLDGFVQQLENPGKETLRNISEYLTAVAQAFYSTIKNRNHPLFPYMQRGKSHQQYALELKQIAGRVAVTFERWSNQPTTYLRARARIVLFEVRTAVENVDPRP